MQPDTILPLWEHALTGQEHVAKPCSANWHICLRGRGDSGTLGQEGSKVPTGLASALEDWCRRDAEGLGGIGRWARVGVCEMGRWGDVHKQSGAFLSSLMLPTCIGD
jgi:hypothetical protein